MILVDRRGSMRVGVVEETLVRQLHFFMNPG